MRRRWIACTIGALVAIGLLVVGGLLWHSGDDWRTWSAHQVQTSATVVDIVSDTGGRGPGSTTVAFGFLDATGAGRQGSVLLTRTDAYHVGDVAQIYYDADDPGHVALVDRPKEPPPIPWLAPTCAGLCVLAFVAVAAWRLRASARILRDNPWVVAESRLVELALDGVAGRNVLRMLELVGAPDEGPVLAAPIALRAQLIDQLVPQAWVAGSDRRFVAGAPGGARLLRMRRVRLIGGRAVDAPETPLRSRLDGAD